MITSAARGRSGTIGIHYEGKSHKPAGDQRVSARARCAPRHHDGRDAALTPRARGMQTSGMRMFRTDNPLRPHVAEVKNTNIGEGKQDVPVGTK